MKPIAVIQGSDGFDKDVCSNLLFFYRQLGFKVLLGDRWLPIADLIVITRPTCPSLPNPQQYDVHFWDYVGADCSELLQKIGAFKSVRVFTSSKKRSDWMLSSFSGLRDSVEILLPPVKVSLWTRKVVTSDYQIVHIGNFKETMNDMEISEWNQTCIKLETPVINVWGNRWTRSNLAFVKVHGQISMRKANDVYARSQLAVGIMYPFQRGLTISGRYWQAPLNGCPLLVEAEAILDDIPGVISNVHPRMLDLDSRKDLSQQARQYWNEHYRKCLNVVSGDIKGLVSNLGGSPYSHLVLHIARVISFFRFIYWWR